MQQQQYPIGVLGQPWGESEKKEWLQQQRVQRSYEADVISQIERFKARFDVREYGQLEYASQRYPLYAVLSLDWDDEKPTVLITGGVHGYETSGVHGALKFIDEQMQAYQDVFNFIVTPCISPWGYETINRWNPDAVDPNRSFYQPSPAQESGFVLQLIADLGVDLLAHVDLHETTDTDNSEFRPAKAARDGEVNTNWNIPDGFYLVTNSENKQIEFQQAVLAEVAKVTHIAPADENNRLIGTDIDIPGVISYPTHELGLCIGLSQAMYATTTEVYPDSENATPEQCIDAQVAAVVGALNYLR